MRFDKFTLKAQEAIQEAQSLAEKSGHQQVDSLHALVALLAQEGGAVVPTLQKLGADVAALKAGAISELDKLPKVSGAAAARELIAEEGYDPVYGARPLKRVIQQRIPNPLSLRILDGAYPEGSTVKVDAKKGEVVFG